MERTIVAGTGGVGCSALGLGAGHSGVLGLGCEGAAEAAEDDARAIARDRASAGGEGGSREREGCLFQRKMMLAAETV